MSCHANMWHTETVQFVMPVVANELREFVF